jgi:HEAT repeat protein
MSFVKSGLRKSVKSILLAVLSALSILSYTKVRAATFAFQDPQQDYISDCIKDLQNGKLEAKRAAASTLWSNARHAKPAIAALIANVGDADRELRYLCVSALGGTGVSEPKVREALIGALKDEDAGVRLAAVRGLAQIGANSEDSLAALQKALSDKDTFIRISAANALWQLDKTSSAKVLPVLIDGLEDKSGKRASVQCWAAAFLVVMRSEAVPKLAEFLDKKTPNRWLAAGLLAYIAEEGAKFDKAAIAVLIRTLKDSEPGVRADAAKALGLIGSDAREALPEINRLLADDNENVRRSTSKALESINRAIK